jgi:hypothetical protein
MQSINFDTEGMDWMPGTPLFGPGAVRQGHDLVRIKTLSERRAEGEGVAYIFRFTPPAGQVIRVIAVARSDEHQLQMQTGAVLPLSRTSRNQEGEAPPSAVQAIWDDPPIHIRPIVPASAGARDKNPGTLVDRSRAPMDLKTIRTILGDRGRPKYLHATCGRPNGKSRSRDLRMI